MMEPKQFETFRFEGLGPVEIDVQLSNTEREILRQQAIPGGPLWKIIAGLLDSARLLEQTIANTPFTSAENMRAARDFQIMRDAVLWHHSNWERLLTPIPEQPNNEAGQ